MLNRRHLLQAGAVAWTAASASRVRGANRRLRIALIGCGGRGKRVASAIVESPDVEYVAMCDVYKPQAALAKKDLNPAADEYQDFRRALDRDDIDAIHIATPDHWHAIPAVLALEAGKHIYCEKPLGHNIVEGRAIVEAAAKRPDLVFLTGTQQRSAEHIAEVEQMIRDGVIEHVHFVRVWNFANLMPEGTPERPDEAVPDGLDWDMYLGPAPWVPFNRARFLRTYRAFYDYAGGWITDFGTHRFDTVHQVMGKDIPLAVAASGGRFAVGGMSDQPDILHVSYQYPDFVLSYEAINTNSFGAMGQVTPDHVYYGARDEYSRPNGMAFYGSNGTIVLDRLGYEVFPPAPERRGPYSGGASESAKPLERRARQGEDPTPAHAAHFVRAVRDGEKSRCDALVGHRSTIIPHLGNIAYKAGERLHWDAASETFVGADDATRRLGRRARAPWDLITVEES